MTNVYPSVPPPAPDLQSLAASVNALRQITDILTNPGQNKAVRYSDLSTVTYKIDSYIQTNNALVEQLSQIVGGPDQTLAQLQTTVEALDARITTDEEAVATANSTIATLTTNVQSLNAQVTEIINSTTDPTGSIAEINTRVTALSGQVDGLTSSVSTEQTAINSINGTLSARYAVTVTAGNKVSGISLLADNSNATSFNVQADKFNIWAAGYTDTPVFSFGTINGTAALTINGNQVADLSVLTNGLGANSVSNSASSSGSGASGDAVITVRPGARVLVIGYYTGGTVSPFLGGVLAITVNGSTGDAVNVPSAQAGSFVVYYGTSLITARNYGSTTTITANASFSFGGGSVTVYVQELAK